MRRQVLALVFVSFAVVFVAAAGEDGNGVTDEVKAEKVTDAPAVVKKVCDVCNCTGRTIDCSNRNLTTNLNDYEWPKIPIDLLSFNDNQITRIKPFPNVTVYNLTLCHNKIERIDPIAFKLLTNLTRLDLSHNLLTFENLMPDAFEGSFRVEAYEPLEKLRILDLSWNQLHIVHRQLFEHMNDLQILSLAGNPLTFFQTDTTYSLNEVPYLQELDLSYCKLKKMDEASLHSVRFLKKLNVSYNEFKFLPSALQSVPALQKLILDGNPIEILNRMDAFPPLQNLTELSMQNMPQLLTIDNGALSELPALEVLTIENCPLLEEIEGGVLSKQNYNASTIWPTLRKLNIANNSLRYLPSELLARWDKLEELHLMSNQWSCDCDNQYLIGSLLPENAKRLMGEAEYAKLNCSSPPEHLGKSLKSLADRKLRCPDLYGARPERDAAVLVGMLLGVLLAVPVVLIVFVMWRRGFLFCGKSGPATFSRAFYKRAAPYDYDI